MKTLILLKSITVIMAVFIVIGICLVGVKISDFSQKSKRDIGEEIRLKGDEKIADISGCGDYLCLWIAGKKEEKMITVHPKTGKIQRVIPVLREY